MNDNINSNQTFSLTQEQLIDLINYTTNFIKINEDTWKGRYLFPNDLVEELTDEQLLQRLLDKVHTPKELSVLDGLEIVEISFSEEKPSVQKVDDIFISYFFSEPDQGWWLVYSNKELDERETRDVMTDENMDKYFRG